LKQFLFERIEIAHVYWIAVIIAFIITGFIVAKRKKKALNMDSKSPRRLGPRRLEREVAA
jgi:positive regulator of sigma E activity